MKKRHGLPVPERTEAAPDQRVKWLRAIRIGLCLALGCSLTLMLIFTCMVLGQEYYFAKLEAEGMLVFRAHPHTPYYIAMIQLSGLSIMLISLLLIFRANWQAWTQPQTKRTIKRRRICDPDQEKFDQ